MNKVAAQNIVIFLDRAAINGHKEREVMNQIIQVLSEYLKDEEDVSAPVEEFVVAD